MLIVDLMRILNVIPKTGIMNYGDWSVVIPILAITSSLKRCNLSNLDFIRKYFITHIRIENIFNQKNNQMSTIWLFIPWKSLELLFLWVLIIRISFSVTWAMWISIMDCGSCLIIFSARVKTNYWNHLVLAFSITFTL